MTFFKAMLPLVAASVSVACSAGQVLQDGNATQQIAGENPATMVAPRLLFRCTLGDTGESYQVWERDGLIGFGPQPTIFLPRSVDKIAAPSGEGDFRAWLISPKAGGEGDPVEIFIGTDLNPDGITSEGTTSPCRFKATANTGLLDLLAKSQQRGEDPGTMVRPSLLFKCTLEDSGESFQVWERDGQIGFGPEPTLFFPRPIRKIVDPSGEGDFRAWAILTAAGVEGDTVTLNVGTDLNPDSISSEGITTACRFKATVNTGLLDALSR